MRGGQCGASRVLASLPETGCRLLSGQARLPVGLQLPKKCIAPQRGLHPFGERGPRTCWGWDEVPKSPHHARDTPCAETAPPLASPCARWTVWGSAGDTWARRKAEERGFAAAAPSRLQFAVGFVAAAGECGNRSGAGSSGEAAGLLHIRVLTPRLAILPARPAPPSPPDDPASSASCLRGSRCPLTARYSPRTPAWPRLPRTTLVCLNVAVEPWTPPDQLPRPHLAALRWDLVPFTAAHWPSSLPFFRARGPHAMS